LHAADVILQAPPCPLERVINGNIKVGIALVLPYCARNIDLPAIRQGEPDIYLVKPL
jgi:hypothetical protein